MQAFDQKQNQSANQNTAGLVKKHALSPVQSKQGSENFDQDIYEPSLKHKHTFSQMSLYPPVMVQPKLTINQPNDIYEREADAMADKVMRKPGKEIASFNSGKEYIQRKCKECEEEKKGLQRKESNNAIPSVSPEVHQTLQSPGISMDSSIKSYMENRFAHDFGKVKIHNNITANQSARNIQALAYTHLNNIVFGDGQYQPQTEPGKKLLAHELTHVIQQTGGSSATKPSTGHPASIQRYTAFTAADQSAGKSLGWKHPSSSDLRVSDDGQMVVEDNGWGANKDKLAWTTPAKIAASNAILSSQASRIKLVSKGTKLSGNVPQSPKVSSSLELIEPVKSAGGSLDLEADCGSACKQVMGSGSGEKDVAVLKQGKNEQYTAPHDYHGDDPTTPEEWSEEIFKKEFGSGLTRSQAYAKYAALSPADKNKFDQKYGINKFAVPSVGQGITVSTEKDMPGFAIAPGGSASKTWNFHYAATVLSSGSDYVTLENAAGWAPTDWIFFMYGPASKGQTFHEFHGATGTHGTKWTSMVVQPERLLHVKTKIKDAPLLIGSAITKLPLGTSVQILEHMENQGMEWRRVKVEGGPHDKKEGMILSTYL